MLILNGKLTGGVGYMMHVQSNSHCTRSKKVLDHTRSESFPVLDAIPHDGRPPHTRKPPMSTRLLAFRILPHMRKHRIEDVAHGKKQRYSQLRKQSTMCI
jgi:hypothetical protein